MAEDGGIGLVTASFAVVLLGVVDGLVEIPVAVPFTSAFVLGVVKACLGVVVVVSRGAATAVHGGVVVVVASAAVRHAWESGWFWRRKVRFRDEFNLFYPGRFEGLIVVFSRIR